MPPRSLPLPVSACLSSGSYSARLTKPTLLRAPDVCRVEPFRGLLHLEFHTLAITQHLVPLEALDVVAVHEDVTAAFVGEYEPVPFRGVEPLNLAFCHVSKSALCPDNVRLVRFR